MRLGCLFCVLGLFLAVTVAPAQAPQKSPDDPTELHVPRPLPPNDQLLPKDDTKTGAEENDSWHEGAAKAKRILFDASYVTWWFRSERAPVDLTLTADSLVDTDLLPITIKHRKRMQGGGRFALGWWDLDCDPVLDRHGTLLRYSGFEITGLWILEKSFDFRNTPGPVIFRPFFDVNNNRLAAVFVAAPGLGSGTFMGSASLDLWGVEANVWGNVYENSPSTCVRVDFMAGLRNLNFQSQLELHRSTLYNTSLPAFPAFASLAGVRLNDSDSFGADNHFFGGQVGASFKTYFLAAEISTTFKLGVGWNHQELSIDGRQTRTNPDGTTSLLRGGLYALNTNIGEHQRTRVSVLPELDFNIAIPFGNRLTVNLGYTFLYWDRVIRAANQIDRVIDITQIPSFPTGGVASTGEAHPGVLFRDRSLFIQGFNVGLTFVW